MVESRNTPRCLSLAYYLADERTPVLPGGRQWQKQIPLHLEDLSGDRTERPQPGAPRYGDYFLAAADFLCSRSGALLAAAVAEIFGKPVAAAQIDEVSLFLEKHGAFYHPSRIKVRCGRDAASLVLNVAANETGRRHLQREFSLIRSLGGGSAGHLPRLFCCGAGRMPDGRTLPMFLGEWFDGFFEFHLTGRGDQTVLWDPAAGPRMLSAPQRRNLYRGVARILAETYSLETGGRVHPWHHGAGDFILRDGSGERIDLKLITVRGYPSSIPEGKTAPQQVLRELIVFFLHLSMRTRIDRADGTGHLLWADETAVEPTLVGFAEGLAGRSMPGHPDSVADLFLGVIRELPPEALGALAEEALAHFGAEAAEIRIARRQLDGHLREMTAAVEGLS